ncbi:MAG TPA: Xaa-Pro peptidase family protein [bacterium]
MRQGIEKLRERLQHFQLEALLVTSLANIRYLFGFTGSSAIAYVAPDLCFFVTDRRYRHQVKSEVQGAEIFVAVQDLYGELKRAKLRARTRVGVEAQYISLKNFAHLRKTFPDVKWIATERIVERIASVKTPDEIAYIKKAAEICGRVYLDLLPLVKAGVRELELSAEISYRTRRAGSERDPFEPIVASGQRSALPHGISSPKVIELGDFVILDFGAVVNGYAADITRTVVVGEPTAKQKEMASVVGESLQLAAAAGKAGMIGKQLDGIAREYLAQQGYGDFFQHSLGHGLGIEVHGLPRIGDLSEDPLEIGNVVALEPGVYLPELGGVRVEDDFVITAGRFKNLSPFSREVISVG